MNASRSTNTYRSQTVLAHDWLNQAGGAEVVLGVLHEMLPSAPIYTTLVDPAAVPAAADWDVRPSWLNRWPALRRRPQALLPIYPYVWSKTRVPATTALVVSNKSAFCHGIDAGAAVHVCYCLTPTRFVWQLDDYLTHERIPPGGRLAIRALLPALRRFDHAAAQRVDAFVAISSVVAERIRRFYGRESTIVFPPVDVDSYAPGSARTSRASPPEPLVALSDDAEPYDLVVARLVPYKQIDLAVAAFNRLGRRLVVVGDGRDRRRLEALAGPTITFTGRLPDADVKRLLAGCRALIWPGVEDYGLVPVEAMASGRPVIARRAGGVLDTVVEGATGLFFDDPSADSLAAAVRAADGTEWVSGAIRQHARRFDRATFEVRLNACLDQALAHGKRPIGTPTRRPVRNVV